MSHRAKLAELAALRASKKTRLASYEIAPEERVYEEVDEDGYKKVVRERLDQDDFVVDDNGAGYADDGREDWARDEPLETDSESETETRRTQKSSKRKRDQEREAAQKTTHSINKYFASGAAAKIPKPKAVPKTTAEDVNFMANILDEVNTNILPQPASTTSRTIKTDSRRKVRILSPPAEHDLPKRSAQSGAGITHLSKRTSDDAISAPALDDDYLPPPMEDNDTTMQDPVPSSSPAAKAAIRKIISGNAAEAGSDDDEANDDLDMGEAVGSHAASTASVNISGARPAPKRLQKPTYPTPESSSPTRPGNSAGSANASDTVNPDAWTDVTARLNVLSSPAMPTAFGKIALADAAEKDGSLRFFWTDYTEINGSLCLFGKVKDQRSGTFMSAFVKVDNILRKVYFLPREFRRQKGKITDQEVEMSEVYDEVDDLLGKMGVREHKMKPCVRKYAFELADVPREGDYLKLMYSYNRTALPTDIVGDTFSHAFGVNTALFEQFVLWKNIMGPCWLRIEGDALKSLNNASWCKLEVEVDDPRSIAPLAEAENLDAPPLTVMSLAFRMAMNVKENKQEILMASARIYEGFMLSDTTPPEQLPCKTFTVMRPADGKKFPLGFEALCKQQRGSFMLEQNEQMLLSKFMALLEKADPDVLVGHSLQDVDYPILLSRLRERRTPQWHRIGRLRRQDWPKTMGKGGNSFFAERQLVAGRLLCDVANDLGKSSMSKCQSWSLAEMCSLYLTDAGAARQDIDHAVALQTWASTKDGLLNYVRHCEADTYFIAALAMRVQLLPLSKVLTNLAGNSWGRTLSGTRAERNEYILLHEFYKNKYICPDKVWGRARAKADEDAADGEEGIDTKKKDKYKGGLVFEPEKGLYDRFVLVMDFNSLYPSIIQEFNICFTTVNRSGLKEDEDKVPDLPTDTSPGILPRLIATLVSRRREVKKLMKNPRATAEEIATWDIKQLALKLTANSMYGCLGYTQSRFYARPLAMLTTFKGREILRSTKELAEDSSLRVVYGDTDSVMINTNVTQLDEALKVGQEFKRAVNERYRLLEIDIDNVFKRLLLHAKKKYAAISLVKVEDKYIEKLEVKGLDMKRREYCNLSKEISSRLLHEILSGEDPEVALTQIHEYLREISEAMREAKVPNQKFIIYTKLGKDPRSYPNADSMPQVQVALRSLAEGKQVRINDVIAYITCAQAEGLPEPSAKRAYAPMDVQKSGGTLRPDIEWYLAKQIFPPIERLCAPIDGTDAARLAECLGLDPKRYSYISGNAGGARSDGIADVLPLDCQLPDAVRYQECPRLRLVCNGCQHGFVFEGLRASSASDMDALTPNGLVCPRSTGGCGRPFSTLTLVAQMEAALRRLASSYYDGYVQCDDPSCGNKTRSLSVYGHRCLGPQGRARGCLGRATWTVGGRFVGRTLGYWKSLWDVDKEFKDAAGTGGVRSNAKADARGDGKTDGQSGEDGMVDDEQRLQALRDWNRTRFGTLRAVVEGYERRCGWVWVQMDSLFSYALR